MRIFYWSSGTGGDFWCGLLNLSRGKSCGVSTLNQWRHHDQFIINAHKNASDFIGTNTWIGTHFYRDGDWNYDWGSVCDKSLWLMADNFVGEVITKKLWDMKANNLVDNHHRIVVTPPANGVKVSWTSLVLDRDRESLLNMMRELEIDADPNDVATALKRWQYYNEQLYARRHKDKLRDVNRDLKQTWKDYQGDIKHLPEFMDDFLNQSLQ